MPHLNAEKSLALAKVLFPLEDWIPHENGIFISKSRLTGGYKEQRLFQNFSFWKSYLRFK